MRCAGPLPARKSLVVIDKTLQGLGIHLFVRRYLLLLLAAPLHHLRKPRWAQLHPVVDALPQGFVVFSRLFIHP